MSVTIRILLGLLSIALLPLAAAGSHVDLDVDSHGYGNCTSGDQAFAVNRASGNVSAHTGHSASASAGTYCEAYPEFFGNDTHRHSEIGAAAGFCDPSGCERAQARWWSHRGGHGPTYCDSEVRVGSEGENLGCPAGSPPYVRPLTP